MKYCIVLLLLEIVIGNVMDIQIVLVIFIVICKDVKVLVSMDLRRIGWRGFCECDVKYSPCGLGDVRFGEMV